MDTCWCVGVCSSHRTTVRWHALCWFQKTGQMDKLSKTLLRSTSANKWSRRETSLFSLTLHEACSMREKYRICKSRPSILGRGLVEYINSVKSTLQHVIEWGCSILNIIFERLHSRFPYEWVAREPTQRTNSFTNQLHTPSTKS